jgi:hypothetical protein
MEVTSLKLLEMEKSVYLDELLNSDKLLIGLESKIKKNNLDNYSESKDFKEIEDSREIDSSSLKPNVDSNYDEVESRINEKKEIIEPVTSDLISFDKIQDNWKNFIDKLHIKKPSVASVLENSIPVNYENRKITIQIASSLDFHISMIDKNFDLIKSLLKEEFKIELDFVINKKPQVLSDNDKAQDITEESSRQNGDQLRDKIVDLFDGEILT